MTNREKFEIEATCIAETDAAIKVRTEHGEDWVPKSHVDDDSEVYSLDDEGTLVVTQWIAEQKGWIR